MPVIDKMVRVDLRVVAMDVPPQDVITRDNVSVKVNAVIYFRVLQADRAFLQVTDFLFDRVIGKGPLDHDKCVAYWGGEEQDVCKELK